MPSRLFLRFIALRALNAQIRHASTTSNPASNSRLDKVLNRLPLFLRPYTTGLRNAPISHVTSFLILHEITAIVPLVALAGVFHYTNWLPRTWVEGRWVREGVERFGRYFGRKGWFGFTPEASNPLPNIKERKEGEHHDIVGIVSHAETSKIERDGELKGEGVDVEEVEGAVERRWGVGEGGGKILVEVATAYGITKVFLPARILVSIWATPWFARTILGGIGGLFGRGANIVPGTASAAAGTGAIGRGALSKGIDAGKKLP